jgi:hypothetical protein
MNDQSPKNLPDLPESSDKEFWGEGQRYSHKPIPIKVCHIHTGKEWKKHGGYIDNHDGTITCKWCPWGTRIPGYLKVVDGRIIDLRSITR